MMTPNWGAVRVTLETRDHRAALYQAWRQHSPCTALTALAVAYGPAYYQLGVDQTVAAEVEYLSDALHSVLTDMSLWRVRSVEVVSCCV